MKTPTFQVNKYFKKNSPWFNLKEFEDINDFDLLCMAFALHQEDFSVAIFIDEIQHFGDYNKITYEEILVRLKFLHDKGLLILTEDSVSYSNETMFILIKLLANRTSYSECIDFLLFKDIEYFNDVYLCIRRLLAKRNHCNQIDFQMITGIKLFLRSHLFYNESLKQQIHNEFAHLIPSLLHDFLRDNNHQSIVFLFGTEVQKFIQRCTNPINYNFLSDSWMANRDLDNIPLFDKPISGNYLKTRKSVFGSQAYYSYTAVIDILIRKIINLKNTRKLSKELDSLVENINYDFEFIFLIEQLVKSNPKELIEFFTSDRIDSILFGQDFGEPIPSYHILLVILLGFFPIAKEKSMSQFKKAFLEQEYTQKILNQKCSSAIEVLLHKLMHQIFNLPSPYSPFF